jgi:predicted transposase YbfD/YdcC
MAPVPPASHEPKPDLSIRKYFAKLKDPRRRHRRLHPLQAIIVIALCAVIAGAQDWQEIETFGHKRRAWLRRFLSLPHGIPSHDTFERVFNRLRPQAFQACFRDWVRAVGAALRIKQIAIDGKTLRGSANKKGAKAAIHMVSAFAARQRLVLGQVKVADKSNEIIAIPALLDMLVIEGAIITTDAIGCQRDIAQKVLDKNADYILALKGNQGTLREDVELFAAEQKANGFSDTKITRHKTVDGDHGRIETRTYTVIHDVTWLQERHQWPGLQGVVMVESERQIPGPTPQTDKFERETRFYITSLLWIAAQLGPAVRAHWMVEMACTGSWM